MRTSQVYGLLHRGMIIISHIEPKLPVRSDRDNGAKQPNVGCHVLYVLGMLRPWH